MSRKTERWKGEEKENIDSKKKKKNKRKNFNIKKDKQ